MLQSQMDLVVVTDVKDHDAETTLVLEGGKSAALQKGHADFEYYLQLARRSLTRHSPVGMTLSTSGVVIAMARSDNDIALKVAPGNPDTIKVWFQGHEGTFQVSKENPRFRQILKLLESSLEHHSRLWFVVQRPDQLIVAARPD